MVEKAGVFEVALPAAAAAAAAVESGGGASSSSSSSAAASAAKKDELAGVGLSFYAQIYVLKVPIAELARFHRFDYRSLSAACACASPALTTTTARPRSGPLGRGTR